MNLQMSSCCLTVQNPKVLNLQKQTKAANLHTEEAEKKQIFLAFFLKK